MARRLFVRTCRASRTMFVSIALPTIRMINTPVLKVAIHRGTRMKLIEQGIPFTPRAAWLLNAAKAREYDYLIGMDDYNIVDLRHLVYPEDRPKIHKLLSFAGQTRDIADPWYTGNFDETYADVVAGCEGLLKVL